MSLITRWFGPSRQEAAHSRLLPLPPESPGTASAGRRELIRLVLRDTLVKHGIPTAWIGAELLTASMAGREVGMHLRLLVRHWEPQLFTYGPALQQSLRQRVEQFDPLAGTWLTGISWQYALPAGQKLPEMPNPTLWTARPASRRSQASDDRYRETEPAGL